VWYAPPVFGKAAVIAIILALHIAALLLGLALRKRRRKRLERARKP
jgi:hypothetical protein